jgi:hypothetical protein
MGRILERRRPYQHLDVVARKLRLGHIDLGLDDVLHPEGQVRHRDAFLHPVVHAVDGLVVIPGEVQHRLAHGLRRDSAGMDAAAAHQLARLDQGDLLAELGSVNGSSLSGRAGPDDDQIVDTTHSI